jgi:hypothetical protein
MVPAESQAILSEWPEDFTFSLKTASAAGDRQMLPMQTKRTEIFEFMLGDKDCDCDQACAGDSREDQATLGA